MKKYKYQCSNCNHEFIHENPQSCPACNSEEFIIIGKATGPKWPLYLFIFSVITGTVIFYFSSNYDVVSSDNSGKSISYSLNKNYIEFKGEIDSADVKVKNYLTGKELFRQGNKFYPCESKTFEVQITHDNTYKLDGKSKFDFTMSGGAHKKACRAQINIIQVKGPNSKCEYTIILNKEYRNNKNVEISIDGRNYYSQKTSWSQKEIGNKSKFFARLKNDTYSDISFDFINNGCKIIDKAPTEDVINKSFVKYINDVYKNEKQFRTLLAPYKSSLRIIYKGDKMKLLQFITDIEVEYENNGNELLDKLSIRPGIIYNSDKSSIKEIHVNEN